MASQNNVNRIEVSIVIPTFNRQGSLLRTLDSLFNQTFSQEKFEIIVVDGSTDNTEKIIKDIIKSHQNLRILNSWIKVLHPQEIWELSILMEKSWVLRMMTVLSIQFGLNKH